MNSAVLSVCRRVTKVGLAVLVSCAAAYPQGAVADPEQKLEAIIKRLEAQQSVASDAMRAAKTDAERLQAQALRPGKEFVEEFRNLANSAPGTATGAKAWLWIVDVGSNSGDLDSAREALE